MPMYQEEVHIPNEYVDLSNNAQVHSTSFTLTMAQYDVADVTFTPWNGWMMAHLTISFLVLLELTITVT